MTQKQSPPALPESRRGLYVQALQQIVCEGYGLPKQGKTVPEIGKGFDHAPLAGDYDPGHL
jgi:hypothetical protein